MQDIRLVAPGVALVTATGAIRRAGETEPEPSTRALESWVLAERDGAWRVESFQSSPASAA